MEEKSWKELILFKLDRSLAILGIVIVGCYAIYSGNSDNQVVSTIITTLGMYSGVRTALK